MQLDWRKEEDYGYTKNLSLKEWAWEALKRNESYIEIYVSLSATVSIKDRQKEARKWELEDLYDPALKYKDGVQFVKETYPIMPHSYDDLDKYIDVFEEDDESAISPVLIAEEQGVVIFDLTKDLKGQLKHAEKLLKERQTFFQLSPNGGKDPRIGTAAENQKKWQKHIRVLDAFHSTEDVTKAEVATHLCDLDSHARDVTNESQKLYDLGREAEVAARRFSLNYKNILFKARRQERLWLWHEK